MELLFIDESGDDGVVKSSSEFYILAGVAVEDRFWKETFWKLFNFRQLLFQKYGLRIEELKGEHLFQHEGYLFNTKLEPFDEKWICENLIDLICSDLKVACLVLAKSKNDFLARHPEPLLNPVKLFREEMWREYLFRYEQYLLQKSLASGHPQTAMIFYDRNQERHVKNLVREFARRFDLERSFPAAGVIEDVVFYDSKMSLFIQLADFLASVSLRILKGRRTKDEFEIAAELLNKLKSKQESFGK